MCNGQRMNEFESKKSLKKFQTRNENSDIQKPRIFHTPRTGLHALDENFASFVKPRFDTENCIILTACFTV